MRYLLALMLVSLFAPSSADPTRAEEGMVSNILGAIRARDCGKAVQILKEGVSQKYSRVTLLAGELYEEGLCVPKDWSKAADFYMLAMQRGNAHASGRLVAGYALPGPTYDPAAALWHAQNKGLAPAQCNVGPDIHQDIERYGAELSRWTKSKLDACVYAAGVTAAMTGAMGYPVSAARLSLQGRAKVIFIPASRSFEVDLSDVTIYTADVIDAGKMRDLVSNRASTNFKRDVLEVGQKVLQRYPAPPDIDPAMRSQIVFDFKFVELR